MSKPNPDVDAALLDRLVDGELEPRAQAELLARLDEQPGQWRRLALAFVEAQTLGVELRGVVAEERQAPVRLARCDAASLVAAHGASTAWTKFFSLAATMLIAVGIGFGAGRVWNAYRAADADSPTRPGQTNVAAGNTTGPEVPIVPVSMDALSPQGMMTVQATDGSPVQLPVYDAPPEVRQFLNASESSVPPEVIRALRSRGHDVTQQRRLWPVDLGDGRQIIVPIDEVDVEYVGHRAYQ